MKMSKLSHQVEKKFIEQFDVSEWQVETEDGWKDIISTNKTIEYQVYEVLLDNGLSMKCADNHILIQEDYQEVFAVDSLGKKIRTCLGVSEVVSVKDLGFSENMYDLSINSENHTYYTNGILSHNTTIAALYILWRAIFREEETILIASNKMDSATEVVDRIKYSYEYLPHWMKPGVILYNRKNITFDNGSEIISRATTKDTGRGLSISLLYVDEMAAIDPPHKQQDFWAAIRPTISTGGDCIITSTPISDEDTFAQIWFSATDIYDAYGNEHPRKIGKNGFKAVKYTWKDHPNRDEEWMKKEVASIGLPRFKREHLCEFISDSDTLIDPICLARLTGMDPIAKAGQVRIYDDIDPRKSYLVCLDPSLGTGRDAAAIQVFSLPDFVQVAEWQHNMTNIQGQVKTLRDILIFIEQSAKQKNPNGSVEIYWTIENNTIGEAANIVIQDTGIESFPGQYVSEKKKTRGSRVRRGFSTTNKTKIDACIKFKAWVESDKMILRSNPLISECKNYVSNGASYAAKSGEHDDLISACLLAVRLADRIKLFDPNIEEHFSQAIDEPSPDPLPIFVLRN